MKDDDVDLLDYCNDLADRINLIVDSLLALDKRTREIENFLTTNEATEGIGQ